MRVRLADGPAALAGVAAALAVLFGIAWLSQIAAAALSGALPAELAAIGSATNPIYVLDLGFVLPLALLTAVGLAR
jgi:hypothetical protein